MKKEGRLVLRRSFFCCRIGGGIVIVRQMIVIC